jgi:hypothetical protein
MATRPKTERYLVAGRPPLPTSQTPNDHGHTRHRDIWSQLRQRPRNASERIHSDSEARQLSRDRVLVEHTLRDCPVQFRLRRSKGGSRRFFVAAGDGRLDLFDESTHPAHPGAVHRGTLGGLTYTLFRGFMSGHTLLVNEECGLIGMGLGSVNKSSVSASPFLAGEKRALAQKKPNCRRGVDGRVKPGQARP